MQTKILHVLSLMLLTVCSIDAQIKKGATLLGGQLGFSSTTTDYPSTPGPSTKNSSFSISPAFGKAVQENLVIGADVDFEHSKFNNQNIDEHKSTVYGIGVFVRQYKELGKGFYLLARPGLTEIMCISNRRRHKYLPVYKKITMCNYLFILAWPIALPGNCNWRPA